jgi:hypothetical protein
MGIMTTPHDDVRVRNATLLRSFDRSLRKRNRVDRTRQSNPEAAGLLIDFRPGAPLDERSHPGRASMNDVTTPSSACSSTAACACRSWRA